ncbi:MAG: hypothetical protein ACRDCA_06830 [Serratia sp. (in: enterobacteria)]|uniref:hypothetical protein n=1 Tax=Serratia sp. (in: enterobacteria) TaxID=616 RepID=UPI003F370FA7
MSKSDHDFVNTGKAEQYELEDWLYKRHGFSKKQDNVDKLIDIINTKVKNESTADNITWAELDEALKNNPDWFKSLVAIGQ